MALIKVNMRCKYHDKEKDEEVSRYAPCLMNTDNINSIIPSGIEGVLQIIWNGQTGISLVKADMAELEGQ